MAYINFKEEKEVAKDQLYTRQRIMKNSLIASHLVKQYRNYIHLMRSIAIRSIMKLFLEVAILNGRKSLKRLQI